MVPESMYLNSVRIMAGAGVGFSVSGILSAIIFHEEISRGHESCKSTLMGESP